MKCTLFLCKVGILFCTPLLIVQNAAAASVVEENSWSKTYTTNSTAPSLSIDNIWGDIRIKATTANTITVTVNERLVAADDKEMTKLKTFFALNEQATSDRVSFKVGGDDLWHSKKKIHCRHCKAEFNFEVSVPANTQVDVHTVNDGIIEIDAVAGQITAGNINGPIAITAMQRCQSIKSINDMITLSFAKSPSTDCEVKSINGDITVALPVTSDLNTAFDLMNGEIRSAFELTTLPSPVVVDEQSNGGRKIYRIEQTPLMKIGKGGPTLSFNTLNGDVSLQKQ